MNDTQDIQGDSPQKPPRRARRLRRFAIAGVATALIATAGVFAVQGITHAQGGPGSGHFMHRMGKGAMDPETVGKFIDWRVSAMLSEVDATAEQKNRIGEIAKTAAKELMPLREQHKAARDKAMTLLVAASVDRAALEKVRADELALAETVSRRITRAVADAAEVLTPAQRARLAEQWKARHA
jgi:Spy/CpxP family protein refolding chaperone